MGGFGKFGTIAAAWSLGLLLSGVSATALAAPPVQIAQSAEQTAQNYFYAGFEALQQNRLDEAASMFEGGLQYSPNNAIATYYLGVAYDRMGAFDRAAPLYERAATLAPGTEEGRAAQERLQIARATLDSEPAAPRPRSIREVFESSPAAQGAVAAPEPRRSQPLPPPPIGRSTAPAPSLTARTGPVVAPPYTPPAPAAPVAAPAAPAIQAPAAPTEAAAAPERETERTPGAPLDAASRFSMFGQDSGPGRVPVRMSVDRSAPVVETAPPADMPPVSPTAPAEPPEPPEIVFDPPPPALPEPALAEPVMTEQVRAEPAISDAEGRPFPESAPTEPPVLASAPMDAPVPQDADAATTGPEPRPAARPTVPIEALTADLPRGSTTEDLNARALRFLAAREGGTAPPSTTAAPAARSAAQDRSDRVDGRGGESPAASLNRRVIEQLDAGPGDSMPPAAAIETNVEADAKAQAAPQRAETSSRVVDLREPASARAPALSGPSAARPAVQPPPARTASAPATEPVEQPVEDEMARSLNERSLAALVPDGREAPAPTSAPAAAPTAPPMAAPTVAAPDMRSELSERGGAVAALPLPKDPQSLTLPDGTVYYGDLKDGLPDGTGRLVFKDGSIYVGSFHDGQRSGHGVLEMSGGWRFEGEFQNNRYDGLGEMSWPDGATYVGEFRQGERTGRGVYWWPNGAKYEGNFLAGEPDGIGTYFYPDGRAETGTWEKGRLVSAG